MVQNWLGSNLVGLQFVWISNGTWNPEAQPFKIKTNGGHVGRHFVKNHLKSRHKHPDFEWSGLQMVGTIALAITKAVPFENWTIDIRPSKIKNSGFQMFLDFKWFDFRSLLYPAMREMYFLKNYRCTLDLIRSTNHIHFQIADLSRLMKELGISLYTSSPSVNQDFVVNTLFSEMAVISE